MKFIVDPIVFEKLENVCFGVVVAQGVDNKSVVPEIEEMVIQGMSKIRAQFAGQNIKEHSDIVPYRNAFVQLGYNPNKFPSSIEALVTRIMKGGQIPSINPVVNLANAISLEYVLPIGSHDIDVFKQDIAVRFSASDDRFIPFGSAAEEPVDPDELLYVSGNEVKTRKWIWRQSEKGKITEQSTNMFFPIDGFLGENAEKVMAARDDLAQRIADLFQCQIKTGFVDKTNPVMTLD